MLTQSFVINLVNDILSTLNISPTMKYPANSLLLKPAEAKQIRTITQTDYIEDVWRIYSDKNYKENTKMKTIIILHNKHLNKPNFTARLFGEGMIYGDLKSYLGFRTYDNDMIST